MNCLVPNTVVEIIAFLYELDFYGKSGDFFDTFSTTVAKKMNYSSENCYCFLKTFNETFGVELPPL